MNLEFKIFDYVYITFEEKRYIGQIRKIELTESNIEYFVSFSPNESWQKYTSKDLSNVDIIYNPARQA